MATTLSSVERRATPWLAMRACVADRQRWRTVPVAEIITMQREIATTRARISELEETGRQLRCKK